MATGRQVEREAGMRVARAYGAMVAMGLACLLVLAPAAAQESDTTPEAVSGEEVEKETPAKKWYRGRFEMGLEFQSSERDTDIDLNQRLRVRIDPPKHENLQIRGSLWLNEDLNSDETRTSALRNVNNASRSDVRARLLYLHLDVKDLWQDSVLRIGRQRIAEGIGFNRIDGLYFQKRHPKWTWYGFGGVRASIYDDTHDDLSFGAGALYRPTYRTGLALDTYHGEENRSRRDTVARRPLSYLMGFSFPRKIKKNVSETAAALSVWHDVKPNFRLYGRYLWKDGNGDELRLSATGELLALEVSYEFAYRTQLNRAGDGVNDLRNLFRILGDFEAYDNVFMALHRPLTEKLSLALEVEIQDAENEDPLSANRDFDRTALIFSLDEVRPGLDASIALERWAVTGGESTWSVSGEVSHEWERFDMAFGVDFERYDDRFVQFSPLPQFLERLRFLLIPALFPSLGPLVPFLDTTVVETHENIYVLYAKGKWDVAEDQELSANLSYEQDDGPDSPYWRFRAQYSLEF